jgi:hypothetical protein
MAIGITVVLFLNVSHAKLVLMVLKWNNLGFNMKKFIYKKVYYEFYTYWKSWSFGKTFRMNGSLMWGYDPYISYRFGPFEVRRYN